MREEGRVSVAWIADVVKYLPHDAQLQLINIIKTHGRKVAREAWAELKRKNSIF